MAGAIAEVARQTLAADFRRIDPRSARIVLIEAGPRAAAGLSARPIRLRARRAVARRRRRQDRYACHQLRCARRRYRRRPHRRWHGDLGRGRHRLAGRALARRRGRSRRPRQGQRRSVGCRGIRRFSSSAIPRRGRRQTAARCPASRRRQSRWDTTSAELIAARIARRPAPPPFRYLHLGELATIGRRAAVVKFGRLS